MTTAPQQSHPDTSTIAVLGFLGLLGVLPLGIAAWYFGGRLLAKYDAEPGRWTHRRVVVVGREMALLGYAVFSAEMLLLLFAT